MRRSLSRFSTRLFAMVALFGIGLLLVSAAALTLQWKSLLASRVSEVRSLTEAARHLVEANRKLAADGALTEEAAKARAFTELAAMRYGADGYFFALSEDGVTLAHPNPQQVGKRSWDNVDVKGFKYNADVIPRAMRDGTAQVEYDFNKLGSTEPARKIAVYAYDKPWHIVVATGVYTDDLDQVYWRQASWLAGIAAVIILTLTAIGTALIATTMAPLRRLGDAMAHLSEGKLDESLPEAGSIAEIRAMAASLAVLRDSVIAKRDLERQAAQEREAAEAARRRQAELDEAAAAAQTQVVETVADGLAQVAEGDLTVRLERPFDPQYEKLRQDFNVAVEKLGHTLGSIADEVGTLRSGIAEITAAAEDLSHRTEKQAANLEETAAALDEITVTVNKSADKTRDARGLVTAARTDVDAGSSVMQEAVAAMTAIESSSKRVGEIIGVIDEIAFQTNLLALNAGVEAARAGDSGRGFAVVASEVRALAQRSAAAAREIKSLIQTSSEQIAGGVKLVTTTGQSLGAIVGKIGRIDEVVAEIALGASEQASGLLQVNSAVTEMDKSTQHNASMVEQTTEANRSLADKVEGLSSLIGRFKLSQDGSKPASRPGRTPLHLLAS
jgi:methyl-accepting chemotaxis protein